MKKQVWIVIPEPLPIFQRLMPKLNTPLRAVKYLKGIGYGWHISNLKIYDTPRELSEFRRACKNDWYCESCAMYREHEEICGNASLRLRRPPQSWCYVEGL